METQLQDDRQYTIDEQMVNRQMMSEIQPQRHQLLAALLFYCTGISSKYNNICRIKSNLRSLESFLRDGLVL